MGTIPAVIVDHEGDRFDRLVFAALRFGLVNDRTFEGALFETRGVWVVLEQDQIVFGGSMHARGQRAGYAHLSTDQ